MKKIEVNIGDKFGRWSILNELPKKGQYRQFNCKCDCGTEKEVRLTSLTGNGTQSCGCYGIEQTKKSNTRHGLRNHPLYGIYLKAKSRCEDPNNKQYHSYGGRGIKFMFSSLEEYVEYCESFYIKGLEIDRIDNDGNYEKGNLRCVTGSVNCRNKRTNTILEFKGESHCLIEWSEILGINYSTLRDRFRRGWSAEKCLNY